MRSRKLEIEEWRPSPVPPVSTARRASRTDRWSPRWIGLIGTVLLHGLIVQSVVLGSRSHKSRPPKAQGVGATLIKSAVPPAETLILVDLPQASVNDEPLREDLASLGSSVKDDRIMLLSADPLPHVEIAAEKLAEDADATASLDSGDPAGRAAMFGRYTGQIDARIERAWRRPRSPVNPESRPPADRSQPLAASARNLRDDSFRCQVRILQDRLGRVQEVQILTCNGSVAWQHSLVVAVLEASPLPAPPDPRVFTRALTMSFTAEPFTRSSPVDDYEAASRSLSSDITQ